MDTAPRSPVTGTPTWRALLPLAIVVFAVLVHASAVGPLATEIARDLGVSIPLIGQISTLLLAAMAAAALLAGPFADHFGHRRALLLALAILAVGAAVMGLAPVYSVLLAGGLIAGVGATVLGVVFACAAARYEGDARRVALARIQSVQTAGMILGAPILTAIAAATIWRGAYGVVLATYCVASFLVARALPRDPQPAGRFTPRTVLAAYRPLVGDRGMLALYTASALRALGWIGPFLYLGAFYTERYALSLRQIGLAYMVVSGGMFGGNLAAGRWLAGRDLRRAFAAATTVLALAWAAAYTLSLPTLLTIALATVAAAASGLGWIALTTLLAAETPAGPGTTMTLNSAVFALGSALGSAVGGLLVGLGGFTLLGTVLPVAILAAALLVWRPALVMPRLRARRARRGAAVPAPRDQPVG